MTGQLDCNHRLLHPEYGGAARLKKSTLLLGYGNIDRQDDGVAWHILREIAAAFAVDLPEYPQETLFQLAPAITAAFALQLTPEDAEFVSGFDQVCFIDAHTGRVEDEVNWEMIQASFEPSPFTHHLTPATCLALASSLYQKKPRAALVSVRGYEFGFERQLSPRTKDLVPGAAQRIMDWFTGS